MRQLGVGMIHGPGGAAAPEDLLVGVFKIAGAKVLQRRSQQSVQVGITHI